MSFNSLRDLSATIAASLKLVEIRPVRSMKIIFFSFELNEALVRMDADVCIFSSHLSFWDL